MATDWIHIDDAHDIAQSIREDKDKIINAQREMISTLEQSVEFWRSKYETLLESSHRESHT